MKKSKILCISGSHRNGCTEYILNQISNKLNAELILLRKKNITPCKACMNCLKNYECGTKDDSQDIIEKMYKSDLVIFGVPNYFNNVPGLFKIFVDRMLPLYKNKRVSRNEKVKGKKVIFVFVGGGGEVGTEQDVYDALSSATSGMVKYLDLNVIKEFTFMCTNAPDLEVKQSNIDKMIEEIKNIM
ncbi:MAG: flavodoxin family protein [Rickettsiales bacterium]|nr:flavodoxin family protein [Rickettsiales bacterium]